jgi:uncharacterized membrane protein YfbV (UPF0208 family)
VPEENEEESQPTARVIKFLLGLSPLLLAFGYLLALALGSSEQGSVAIGRAAFGMSLGGAGLYRVRGPKAVGDLELLVAILKLIRR